MKRIYLVLGLIVMLALGNIYQAISLKSKDKKIDKLKEELVVLDNRVTLCDAYLKMQSSKIRSLELKGEPKPSKEIDRIKEIYVKDKSCEAELKAYKELFK